MSGPLRLLRRAAGGALLAARASKVQEKMQEAIARAARRAAVLLVALILVTIGLAFLLAAVYLQLSEWLGPKGAAALVAAVFLLLGLGFFLLGTRRSAPAANKQPAAPKTGEQVARIGKSLQDLSNDLIQLGRDNPQLLIAGAFVVGLLSGRRKRGTGD